MVILVADYCERKWALKNNFPQEQRMHIYTRLYMSAFSQEHPLLLNNQPLKQAHDLTEMGAGKYA